MKPDLLQSRWKTLCPDGSESLLTFPLNITDERESQEHLEQQQT